MLAIFKRQSHKGFLIRHFEWSFFFAISEDIETQIRRDAVKPAFQRMRGPVGVLGFINTDKCLLA